MTKTKKLLQGGKYLGEGSYGCVISPAIPCIDKYTQRKTKKQNHHKREKMPKNNTTKGKSVSKIIIAPDKDSKDELIISNLIKQIDPKQTYFITYNEYCQLKHLPNYRNNTSRVRYINNNREEYYSLNNKHKTIKSRKFNVDNDNNHSKGYIKGYNNNNTDEDKCLIDLSLKPINIIMPYGGYDLGDLIRNYDYNYKKKKEYERKLNKLKLQKHKYEKNKSKYNTYLSNYEKEIYKYTHFLTTYTILSTHFKFIFKHLLNGLVKLHNARIVNRDIKLENIMANYNTKTKKLDVRYIDFGLSDSIPHNKCNKKNINYSGSLGYIAPELIISYIMYTYSYDDYYSTTKKHNEEDYSYLDIIYLKKMKYSIKSDITENILKNYRDFKEYEFYDNMFSIYNKNKYKKSIFDKIYNDIKTHYDKKTIIDAYFGINSVSTKNGYLQKGDVFALGITMYEYLLHTHSKHFFDKNTKLHHLLKYMIHPDSEQRYNVNECLSHSYFK